MKHNLLRTIRYVFQAGLVIMLLNGCAFDINWLIPPTATPSYPDVPPPTPQPMAEVTFTVTLPAPLVAGENLLLSVVDEITGLALNTSNTIMQGQDALHYSITIPFPIYSVVKYRYVRQAGLPVIEDSSGDIPVRYRMFYVTGPGAVTDVVSSWSDSPFAGPTGRVTGSVVNAADGKPIPDILVAAGGLQTLTDSTGSFTLEGLPTGTHNLVAYALDGSYRIFQQGTNISAGLKTPVSISLNPVPLVDVTFTVIVPRDTIPSVPIRLAGNLYQLGNTFGDLRGGFSTVATRMPSMQSLPDGRYSITLKLPVGADIRYKYTLGDGFWNAEHEAGGRFVLRQLIVPSEPLAIQDQVITWAAGSSASILFEVDAPPNTPFADIVSLQINPYGWTEPVPMWPLGNNRWAYTLYSPLNLIGSFEYRYCRNEQCGSADDAMTTSNHRGRLAATSLVPQDLQDDVNSWEWYGVESGGQVLGVPVQAHGPDFIAGVEFQPDYHPTWQTWMNLALQNVQGIGSNWVVLAPTWTVSRIAPLVFAATPGQDPLWADSLETISQARALNLNVALFPTPNFSVEANKWWVSALRDAAWWDSWFERYRAFLLYYADLAGQQGVSMLILGGDWIAPSLPNGLLADGSSSGVPADAEARWGAMLSDVRQHFAGKVYWALPYSGGQSSAPAFLRELDGIYLLWQAPLSTANAPTVEEMQAEAGRLLDGDIFSLGQFWVKPIVLAPVYPSVAGAAKGCLPDGSGGCLDWTAISRPNPDRTDFTIDLKAQLDIYQAMLGAVNSRVWVAGFVSRGYYPPVILQDKSASIHGKPASDALWYWFPRLTGAVK